MVKVKEFVKRNLGEILVILWFIGIGLLATYFS